MKVANVYMHNDLAGFLIENEAGYTFQYDFDYLTKESVAPISLTLPLQKEPFESNVLFPFFDGLIPEGWLLDIAQQNWKIQRNDRMSLLMVCCKDCIGAVSVIPKNEENE